MENSICYIVAAGDTFDMDPDRREGDLVIAADSGYLNLLRAGLTADLTVGDFDSLGSIPTDTGIIRHPVRKDDTDTMLAAKVGYERGYRRFVILGGTGGSRQDHTIANLQTLIWLAERGADAYMFAGSYAYTAIHNSEIIFSPEDSGGISVFCFGADARGVRERGLSYTLDGETLTASFPLGVSNSFTGQDASISVENGTLVIWWETDAVKLKKMLAG